MRDQITPSRLPAALRAATATAIPVLTGSALGAVGAGLVASIGGFTTRFGAGRPFVSRGVQLAVVVVSLAAAVTLGSAAADVVWLGILVVSVVAVIAVWLCNALAIGPPGAYMFVVACAAGIGVSAAHLDPIQVGLLVLAGGTVAWTVQMAGALGGLRRPERDAVAAAANAVADFIDAVGTENESAQRNHAAAALHNAWNTLIDLQPVAAKPGGELARLRAATHAVHVLFADAATAAVEGRPPDPQSAALARRLGAGEAAPDSVVAHRLPVGRSTAASRLAHALKPRSHTRRVMVRIAIGVPLAGATTAALGMDRTYWAMAAAVLVLHQGVHLSGTLRRGGQALVGTWLGLGLAAAILVIHPQGWWLALVLALLTFAIEMLIVRNYTLASVFITAIALTIASSTRPLDADEAAHLLLSRGVDVLIGCAVGLAVYLVVARRQEEHRVSEAIGRVDQALVTVADYLDRGDATSLEARSARRDLQRAALEMTEARQAAEHGDRDQRAAATRLLPDCVAVEHRAYETLAAMWAMEARR